MNNKELINKILDKRANRDFIFSVLKENSNNHSIVSNEIEYDFDIMEKIKTTIKVDNRYFALEWHRSKNNSIGGLLWDVSFVEVKRDGGVIIL